jgi:hypothetical protein
VSPTSLVIKNGSDDLAISFSSVIPIQHGRCSELIFDPKRQLAEENHRAAIAASGRSHGFIVLFENKVS